MNIVQFIEQYHLPNKSRIIDMQHVMDTHSELNSAEYCIRINELAGQGDDFGDREARYIYLYLVQEMLALHFRGVCDINGANVLAIAITKATKYIANNQHLFVEREDEVKVDASTGKVKLKRGAKKDKVCALWAEHADKEMSRKEWIDLLMKEVDMTKAGASTYYANLVKGTFGC